MADGTTAIIHIEGMNCASCLGRVERVLNALPQVRAASVNLASETATLSLDGQAGLEPAVSALKQAGYPARTETAMLQVNGLNCASCVGRVQGYLVKAPGVVSAQVNLASETAQVTFLPGAVSAAALARLITEKGYPATPQSRPAPDSSASGRKAREAAELGRATWIAATLALPVFAVEMGGHLVPAVHHLIDQTIGQTASRLMQFVLTTLVLAGPGRRFYTKGLPQLLRGTPDMNALVALGTLAAYGFSTVSTFAPGLLPAGSAHVYFEAAAVIVVLILLGRWLEARAKGRTGDAIARLVGLRPATAHVARDGARPRAIAVDDIVTGDLIHLRPGERVAVDGVVTEGTSFIDESMLTGEPAPVSRNPGDPVTGGTVNGAGALVFRATRVGEDTTLAQIIRMVAEAQGAKLPIQGLLDRVTQWFVPAVMAVAAVTFLVWLILAPAPALGLALVSGVAVLIIACPCAMGLAAPTSIIVGTGRAAEAGVLFRQGEALQSLQDVAVVAFDKTGTLTQGRPELTDLIAAPGVDEDALLAQLAGVEAMSEHPVADAIRRAAMDKGLVPATADGFEVMPGLGVRARVDGQVIVVGAGRFMTREGVLPAAVSPDAQALSSQGRSVVFAAIDGQLAATLGVADPVKPEARATIDALHAQGLATAMITGDGAETAQAVADQLGIAHVVPEVMPDGKVAALDALRAQGRTAFVGDGINDAPALAAADVGIAIGTGTDVAIEAADVVLMSGRLTGVATAFTLSRATMRNIRQNLFWAFGYNVVLIPVAAGALYPAWGVQLSPVLAAGAMALSSVFVLTNALRLKWA